MGNEWLRKAQGLTCGSQHGGGGALFFSGGGAQAKNDFCYLPFDDAARMPGGNVASAQSSGHIINDIARSQISASLHKLPRQIADAVARSLYLTYFQTGRSRLAGMKSN